MIFCTPPLNASCRELFICTFKYVVVLLVSRKNIFCVSAQEVQFGCIGIYSDNSLLDDFEEAGDFPPKITDYVQVFLDTIKLPFKKIAWFIATFFLVFWMNQNISKLWSNDDFNTKRCMPSVLFNHIFCKMHHHGMHVSFAPRFWELLQEPFNKTMTANFTPHEPMKMVFTLDDGKNHYDQWRQDNCAYWMQRSCVGKHIQLNGSIANMDYYQSCPALVAMQIVQRDIISGMMTHICWVYVVQEYLSWPDLSYIM